MIVGFGGWGPVSMQQNYTKVLKPKPKPYPLLGAEKPLEAQYIPPAKFPHAERNPVEGSILMKIVRVTKKLIRTGQNIDRIKVLAG